MYKHVSEATGLFLEVADGDEAETTKVVTRRQHQRELPADCLYSVLPCLVVSPITQTIATNSTVHNLLQPAQRTHSPHTTATTSDPHYPLPAGTASSLPLGRPIPLLHACARLPPRQLALRLGSALQSPYWVPPFFALALIREELLRSKITASLGIRWQRRVKVVVHPHWLAASIIC